jgi:hypothetical protein
MGQKLATIGEICINPLNEVVKIPIEGIFLSNECSGPHAPLPDPKACTGFCLDSRSEVGDLVLLYRHDTRNPVPSSTDSSSSVTIATDSAVASSQSLSPTHLSSASKAVNNSNKSSIDIDPEVWFQDLAGRWHFICPTFTHLMRIMIVHLGISGWQLVFTPEGEMTVQAVPESL